MVFLTKIDMFRLLRHEKRPNSTGEAGLSVSFQLHKYQSALGYDVETDDDFIVDELVSKIREQIRE